MLRCPDEEPESSFIQQAPKSPTADSIHFNIKVREIIKPERAEEGGRDGFSAVRRLRLASLINTADVRNWQRKSPKLMTSRVSL